MGRLQLSGKRRRLEMILSSSSAMCPCSVNDKIRFPPRADFDLTRGCHSDYDRKTI